jgi:hypothetical protein
VTSGARGYGENSFLLFQPTSQVGLGGAYCTRCATHDVVGLCVGLCVSRSVSLAARSSDSGMHVDSCVWSITNVVLRCLCWRLLSRLTWAILLRLAWIPWLGHRGTVPWSGASGEKPAAAAGMERGAGADPATPSRPWPCVRRATVRLLYARCGRPLSELGLGESRLCLGRAHAEPELHVGGYSPHIRRCAVFDEISSNMRPSVTSRVQTDV